MQALSVVAELGRPGAAAVAVAVGARSEEQMHHSGGSSPCCADLEERSLALRM